MYNISVNDDTFKLSRDLWDDYLDVEFGGIDMDDMDMNCKCIRNSYGID